MSWDIFTITSHLWLHIRIETIGIVTKDFEHQIDRAWSLKSLWYRAVGSRICIEIGRIKKEKDDKMEVILS